MLFRSVLGLAAYSKTTQNLMRTGECALNLPSVNEVAAVNRLALTTGSNPVPDLKKRRVYRYEADKFGIAEMTPVAAETVAPPLVRECPVQLEAVVVASHKLAEGEALLDGFVMCFEVRIQRVHVEESLLISGESNRIDPDKWRPLIMSFQKFYGIGMPLQSSLLEEIPQAMYRSPDIARARNCKV